MSVRPMNDWILIKMDPESEKTSGGLLVKPEGALETLLRTGKVLAVGPGKVTKKGVRVPSSVEPGEGVVFNRVIASQTHTAEALHQHRLEKDEALIQPNDVMLTFDHSNPPEFE